MMVYVLLGACLLLAAALALVAFRRPDSRRLARVAASLVAVAALWLIAYPPRRFVEVARAEAVLLTRNYQPDTLRALLRRLGPATRVWLYAPDSTAARRGPYPTVARLGALREQLPALQQLHVLGEGLPAAVLPELDSVRVVGHAPPAFTGFQAAHWNRRLELGQALLLEGFYAGASRGPVWVRLQAAGATHDSVRLPGGRGRFRLRYTPKAVGRLVATVSAGPVGSLLAAEPVPLEVLPTRPLRVLLLGVAPSFELKFLRNYLAARQHAVAWRTTLSRGLTQTEFSNQPATTLGRLTPALLARYDVLVADAASLAALSASETQTLRATQRQGGLGVVVLAETGLQPRSLAGAAVRVVAQPGPAASQPQRLQWPAAAALVPATLRLAAGARPLVVARQSGRPVVAAQRLGVGTVVVSALPETFPWLLQNNAEAYGSYWSQLLSAAARPAPPEATWTATAPWPRLNLPVGLQLTAAPMPAGAPLVTDAAGVPLARLPLLHDPLLPEWSTALYWPAKKGWQQLQRPGQATQWLYVFGPQDWRGPTAGPRIRLVSSGSSAASDLAAPREQVAVEWPVGWFAALFVLAAGFLWLEEKL